jgi:hypothetical protein
VASPHCGLTCLDAKEPVSAGHRPDLPGTRTLKKRTAGACTDLRVSFTSLLPLAELDASEHLGSALLQHDTCQLLKWRLGDRPCLCSAHGIKEVAWSIQTGKKPTHTCAPTSSISVVPSSTFLSPSVAFCLASFSNTGTSSSTTQLTCYTAIAFFSPSDFYIHWLRLGSKYLGSAILRSPAERHRFMGGRGCFSFLPRSRALYTRSRGCSFLPRSRAL